MSKGNDNNKDCSHEKSGQECAQCDPQSVVDLTGGKLEEVCQAFYNGGSEPVQGKRNSWQYKSPAWSPSMMTRLDYSYHLTHDKNDFGEQCDVHA